jgi:hypothetical protein
MTLCTPPGSRAANSVVSLQIWGLAGGRHCSSAGPGWILQTARIKAAIIPVQLDLIGGRWTTQLPVIPVSSILAARSDNTAMGGGDEGVKWTEARGLWGESGEFIDEQMISWLGDASLFPIREAEMFINLWNLFCYYSPLSRWIQLEGFSCL